MNRHFRRRLLTIKFSAWNFSWPIEPILNCERSSDLFPSSSPRFSRRLSAGHTAIHIACRLGNVPILHMLLSIKKADHSDDEQQREEKHLYSCLRIKDNANLTPVHWAATQESVSKRQKLFAYLDRRMPGVLDSRYNLNWFDSWAKLHPWVIEPIRPTSILKNNEKPSQSQTQDEPSEITSLDMTPKGSNNNYERTPRAPLLANTTNQYNNTFERKLLPSSKRRTQVRTDQAENPPLPTTPKTSCKVTVTSIYHIPRRDQSPPVSPRITTKMWKASSPLLGRSAKAIVFSRYGENSEQCRHCQ